VGGEDFGGLHFSRPRFETAAALQASSFLEGRASLVSFEETQSMCASNDELADI